MPTNPELSDKLRAYQDKIADRAEDIIFNVFPKKLFDLQDLVDASSDPSDPFNIANASTSTDPTVYPDPSRDQRQESKKRKVIDGEGRTTSPNTTENARYAEHVHANKHIEGVHAQLKKECEELALLCTEVEMWLNSTMPKIEDGDNFGVEIQEQALVELHRCQQSAYNLRDSARQHHLTRAKICSKLIKYPNVEDYTLTLKEHDEKVLYAARVDLFDLRSIYAVMINIFHKNIAKIRAPKANNSIALY
ncbi:hypothetical protein EW145_g4145 [Phellinidium pouzarii]|uniref:Proteasome activator PA28 C-terminal domain-containing protein n=1 Tax=Phellinidium pouzarii TaxID=167371 RepID=A0A4V3XCL7_9AGAM|nr:hypothetical protein EW145_g4145 [Phellinidium pouzarii]